MSNDHTPTIDALYWALLLAVTAVGHLASDLVIRNMAVSLAARAFLVVVLAGGLWAIFALEARDRSTTKAWYWLALLFLQMAGSVLADALTFSSAMARLVLYLGPVVLMRAIFHLERSSASVQIADHLHSRTAERPRPGGGYLHWLVAAVLALSNAAGGDLIVFNIGGGLPATLAIVAAIGAVYWWRIRFHSASPVLRFWRIAGYSRTVGVVFANLVSGL